MIHSVVPITIDKPDIIVPGAAPLVHPAQAGLVHLLHDVGGAVVVGKQSLDADIDVLTTRAVLEAMQRRDQPKDSCWARVASVEPTRNPRLQSFESAVGTLLRGAGTTCGDAR